MTDFSPFWSWFREHGDAIVARIYGDSEAERHQAMGELNEHAGDLTVEVTDGERKALVISADGDHQKVDTVKDMVASAPDLSGWDVLAFRPRMTGISIGIGGESLSEDDIRFRTQRGPHGVKLTLWVKGLNAANEQPRGFGAMLLAQHAIGELDAMLMLEDMDVKKPPWLAFLQPSQPLAQLPAVMDELKGSMFPPLGSLPIEDKWTVMEGSHLNDPVIVSVNTGLHPFAGHPEYDTCLLIATRFASKEEADALLERGEQICNRLCEGQQALNAYAVTCVPKGKRTIGVYTSDRDASLAKLQELAADDMEWRVERDTFWGHYREFAGA